MATGARVLVRSGDVPYALEGAGVLVRRLIGPGGAVGRVGPFLLLDHADIPPDVGFPLHPHRGFEVLTYLLRGELTHRDSEGFQATVAAGGAQHLLTGRGLWHEEMPGPAGAESLQIWVDLPPEDQGEPPGYRSIQPPEVPEGEEGPLRFRRVAGSQGAVRFRRPVTIHDLQVEAGGDGTLPPEGSFAFLYVLGGEGRANWKEGETTLGEGDFLVLRGGGPLALEASGGGFRAAVFRG